jgi:hypothetical protein
MPSLSLSTSDYWNVPCTQQTQLSKQATSTLSWKQINFDFQVPSQMRTPPENASKAQRFLQRMASEALPGPSGLSSEPGQVKE